MKNDRDDGLEDDVDALFRLSSAEFTSERNALAARLKKSGRASEAALVKALTKPPISAWAVNQLYWNHREPFDRLLASGERFHKVQTSRSGGKLAEMREALEARREALTELSDLAASLLRDAGHNPTPDAIHRITTTLEALSAFASRADAPRPGRLTQDIDPPGFESHASFIPGAGMTKSASELTRLTPHKKGSSRATKSQQKSADTNARPIEDTRNAKIAGAKDSLQEAKRALAEARARARGLEAAQKKALTEARETEKQRREAEKEKLEAERRFEKARVVSEDAAQRAQTLAVEAKEAARAVKDAERTIKEASKELES